MTTRLNSQPRKKIQFLEDARNFYMLDYFQISIKKKSKLIVIHNARNLFSMGLIYQFQFPDNLWSIGRVVLRRSNLKNTLLACYPLRRMLKIGCVVDKWTSPYLMTCGGWINTNSFLEERSLNLGSTRK